MVEQLKRQWRVRLTAFGLEQEDDAQQVVFLTQVCFVEYITVRDAEAPGNMHRREFEEIGEVYALVDGIGQEESRNFWTMIGLPS